MGASSIQVSDDTRAALRRYKTDGMTYEDVLKLMMQIMPPEEFHALYAKWQKQVADGIRKSKKWSSF
ncbi:MAG: hypothetical protein QOE90_2874 [Thermoplasmata archaeon]|jgi:hypothetical protein|nr:hypothetical protein [Thermoplasmata archaeon]